MSRGNRVGLEHHAGARDPLAHRESRARARHRSANRHARARQDGGRGDLERHAVQRVRARGAGVRRRRARVRSRQSVAATEVRLPAGSARRRERSHENPRCNRAARCAALGECAGRADPRRHGSYRRRPRRAEQCRRAGPRRQDRRGRHRPERAIGRHDRRCEGPRAHARAVRRPVRDRYRRGQPRADDRRLRRDSQRAGLRDAVASRVRCDERLQPALRARARSRASKG